MRLEVLRGEVSKCKVLGRERIHWEWLKKIEEYLEIRISDQCTLPQPQDQGL